MDEQAATLSAFVGAEHDGTTLTFESFFEVESPRLFRAARLLTGSHHEAEELCHAIQPDGEIVVAGVANLDGDAQTFGLVRFDADGTLDPGFGIDGIVTTALTTSGDWGDDLAIQADGKIVVFGNAGGDDPEFGLVRYTPDGTLDPTFGGTGIVMTNFSTIFDWARSVVIQPDGKIVAVGGSAFTGGGTRGSVAVARYDPDRSLDRRSATMGRSGAT